MDGNDYSYRVINLIERYGEDSIEWKSERKKRKVQRKHNIDPDEVKKWIKSKNYSECTLNSEARASFDYRESYIVYKKIDEKFTPNEYIYKIPIYIQSAERKIKIATAYRKR